MSLSNGRGRGLESSGPMKRQKSYPESGERALFLGGGEGRGGVRARDAGGREGVVERDAAAEQVGGGRAVTRDGPGDDVGAVVRARAGLLAEI